MWIDGFCRVCGSLVIEEDADGHRSADYRNTCTNPKCENFGWHHCYDDENLGYYHHENVESAAIPGYCGGGWTIRGANDKSAARDGENHQEGPNVQEADKPNVKG